MSAMTQASAYGKEHLFRQVTGALLHSRTADTSAFTPEAWEECQIW